MSTSKHSTHTYTHTYCTHIVRYKDHGWKGEIILKVLL